MTTPFDVGGRTAVIVTMHDKERVIAPVLTNLGLRILPTPQLDTDRFGTFTRETARREHQWATALSKARAGLALVDADFAISSEGAFGPHPQFPFVPVGVEMLCLLERRTDRALMGTDMDLGTNFRRSQIHDLPAAAAFAASVGFPVHGLVVFDAGGLEVLAKGIREEMALLDTVVDALRLHGTVWLETDMRAHMNPTRMQSIARAASDLARRLGERCPACACPGWDSRTTSGRPCRHCGTATNEPWSRVRHCTACGYRHEEAIEPARQAEPAHCPACNP